MLKRLLVFPCGSEVGLEIHRSLQYSAHFELIGASSVDDHGKHVYENYVGGLPYHDDPEFLPALKIVLDEFGIDGIFPAMDSVARTLKNSEPALGVKVIGSSKEVTALCSSKIDTYEHLKNDIPCPVWATAIDDVVNYPVFIKPDEGYGSRNTFRAPNREAADEFLAKHHPIPFVFCEYLPGNEYTIDCFSNSEGELLFFGARRRVRVTNGISVNTVESDEHGELFKATAHAINKKLKPTGAWFFQMKEASDGKPKLLEVAARLGGSSSCFRAKGVNFALLSAYDAFDVSVDVHPNNYRVELDRALGNRFSLDIDYSAVYVDYDDCLLIADKVNTHLVGFLYKAINEGIRLILITRHEGNLQESLERHRLLNLFDEVVHIRDGSCKSEFITRRDAIFIDDSFKERLSVAQAFGIPVFAPDMVEALI